MSRSLRSRLFFACRRSDRLSSALRTAASTSIACAMNGAASVGSNVVVQKSGVAGIEDQRAQVVLRALDGGLGDDDALFVARDFGLRLHDVDRRHRADLDALLVVLQRLLRQRQRFLLRLQVVDGVRQIPVRVLHVPRRLDDHRVQLNVGEIARLLADRDLLADRVDREVAEQRLRVLEVDVRRNLRAEGGEEVRRRRARAVPVRGIRAAPGQRLDEIHARGEVAVRRCWSPSRQ